MGAPAGEAAAGQEAPSPSPLCALARALWKLKCSSVAWGPHGSAFWVKALPCAGREPCPCSVGSRRWKSVSARSLLARVPRPVSWSLLLL